MSRFHQESQTNHHELPAEHTNDEQSVWLNPWDSVRPWMDHGVSFPGSSGYSAMPVNQHPPPFAYNHGISHGHEQQPVGVTNVNGQCYPHEVHHDMIPLSLSSSELHPQTYQYHNSSPCIQPTHLPQFHPYFHPPGVNPYLAAAWAAQQANSPMVHQNTPLPASNQRFMSQSVTPQLVQPSVLPSSFDLHMERHVHPQYRQNMRDPCISQHTGISQREFPPGSSELGCTPLMTRHALSTPESSPSRSYADGTERTIASTSHQQEIEHMAETPAPRGSRGRAPVAIRSRAKKRGRNATDQHQRSQTALSAIAKEVDVGRGLVQTASAPAASIEAMPAAVAPSTPAVAQAAVAAQQVSSPVRRHRKRRVVALDIQRLGLASDQSDDRTARGTHQATVSEAATGIPRPNHAVSVLTSNGTTACEPPALDLSSIEKRIPLEETTGSPSESTETLRGSDTETRCRKCGKKKHGFRATQLEHVRDYHLPEDQRARRMLAADNLASETEMRAWCEIGSKVRTPWNSVLLASQYNTRRLEEEKQKLEGTLE